MRDTNDSTRLERFAVGTWLDKKGKITGTRVDNDRQSFPLQRRSGKKVVMHLVGILLISTVFLLGCAPDQEPVSALGLCEDDWEGQDAGIWIQPLINRKTIPLPFDTVWCDPSVQDKICCEYSWNTPLYFYQGQMSRSFSLTPAG